MGGQPSYLIILVASAFIGAALAVGASWHHGFFLTLVAAPIGGSLGGFAAALLLYLRERIAGVRIVNANHRPPAEIVDAGRRVSRLPHAEA